jgi:hypothetical protein
MGGGGLKKSKTAAEKVMASPIYSLYLAKSHRSYISEIIKDFNRHAIHSVQADQSK